MKRLFDGKQISILCVFVIVFPGLLIRGPIARAAPPVRIDIDLPSTSTGSPTGTLAVRISAPSLPGDARYRDGAPVVIWVAGGFEPGSLGHQLPPTTNDVVIITFLFPGGNDPPSGRRSAGVYDQRGPDSIVALRDVIRYAAGQLRDARGRTIDEVVPVPVIHSNIGLIGSSNGGNIVVAVAAEHGDELVGYLRYIIQWESPVSSQITTFDLGGPRLECPGNQRQALRAVNPRYRGYGLLELDVDYSQLAYNPADLVNAVFFDGNGDRRYTTVINPANGCRTPDLNLNGVLELNEDFPLTTIAAGNKRAYSRPVTQALSDRRVFGSNWPANLLTVAEANSFWDLREAARLYARAVRRIPGLEGMVLASVEDHVQVVPDHPHIRQAFEGWMNAGGWVQINPSRSYLLRVDPSLSAASIPDNAANTPPTDWADRNAYCVPESLRTETLQLAAVYQMADRVR